MTNKLSITVLDNFNGFKGNVIEVIERKGVEIKQKNSRNSWSRTNKYSISYKGKKYSTFYLADNGYGFYGNCITLKESIC